MCGIAGVVSDDPTLRTPEIVRAMTDRIHHRGPDDEGIACTSTATLGARRLSIIDLAGGHQPLYNEDGRITVVQNGEIYNFAALRRELEALGHRFRTRADTEVLPHAYEAWGVDFVARLRGMFALALWDDRRRRLVLARDRFGKKPLAYAHIGGTLVFGSEIQALLPHPIVPRDVDDDAIASYLAFGYVPAPLSAFAAIRKLPPAHLAVLEDGKLEVRQYWRLDYGPKLSLSMDEAAEELRRRIADAVRVRLVSDVPIGAFLSGGLDSSTVVAFMARESDRPVKTFSIGFRDQAYDELRYAREVAQAFGTEHQEFVVDASETDVLPMLVRHVGEPFADSSIVPTFHVARITRTAVTVALNGDGGDELFAGYNHYRGALLTSLVFDRLPRPAIAAIAAGGRRVPLSTRLPREFRRSRRFLGALDLPPEERYVRWTGYFVGPFWDGATGERMRGRAHPEVQELVRRTLAVDRTDDPVERYMAADVLSALPGDLLVKMDIATMASSLEARSPLLDHELAEFVARLPRSFKLSPRSSKVLLRHAMRDVLPPTVLARTKMGFSAPVGAWLRGPMREQFADLALSDTTSARGYVDRSALRELFDDHLQGRAERTNLLWNAMLLEMWFREVVEMPRPSGVSSPIEVGVSARP